jgi:hypothetical protein
MMISLSHLPDLLRINLPVTSQQKMLSKVRNYFKD